MANEGKIPYVTAYGNIGKALSGIQKASVPDRFPRTSWRRSSA